MHVVAVSVHAAGLGGGRVGALVDLDGPRTGDARRGVIGWVDGAAALGEDGGDGGDCSSEGDEGERKQG